MIEIRGSRLETAEHNLSLRPTRDSVMRRDHAIDGIRIADEKPDHEMQEWPIYPTLFVPSWGVACAPTFNDAKIAFPSGIDHPSRRRALTPGAQLPSSLATRNMTPAVSQTTIAKTEARH
jgi:hypothetical protein